MEPNLLLVWVNVNVCGPGSSSRPDEKAAGAGRRLVKGGQKQSEERKTERKDATALMVKRTVTTLSNTTDHDFRCGRGHRVTWPNSSNVVNLAGRRIKTCCYNKPRVNLWL